MSNDVQSEIADMLKVIDEVPITVTEEVTDDGEKEEKEEGVLTEADTKEAEVKEEVKDEESKDEEEKPVVEEKKETSPVDDKDKTIEELRAQIAALSASKKPEEKKPEAVEPPKIEEQDFVKDFDMDDLTRDPSSLNKILNNVYQKAAADVQSRFNAELPKIISNHVSMMQTMEEAKRTFYSQNEDLKSFGNVVGVVYNELATANSDKSLGEVLKMVAPEVRKRLKLPEPSVQKGEVRKESKPPNLPRKDGKAGNLSVVQPKNNVQSEIEEMNKSLGG